MRHDVHDGVMMQVPWSARSIIRRSRVWADSDTGGVRGRSRGARRAQVRRAAGARDVRVCVCAVSCVARPGETEKNAHLWINANIERSRYTE